MAIRAQIGAYRLLQRAGLIYACPQPRRWSRFRCGAAGGRFRTSGRPPSWLHAYVDSDSAAVERAAWCAAETLPLILAVDSVCWPS